MRRTSSAGGPSVVAIRALVSCSLLAALSASTAAQTFEATHPPGENFDTAAFRLWFDGEDEGALRGLIVLVPGSNSDGRAQVEDPLWQQLAREQRFGLVGAHWTDKPHEDMAIEHYVDVRRGSGAAFLSVLETFAEQTGRSEIASAPLLLWGMSAGGEFNYEFALWRPDRVLGFVVNKGGIYYNAVASPAARAVPGLFFIGAEDIAFRNDIIRGVYSVNRRFGALWALVVEPGTGHVVGGSRELAKSFYEDVIGLRLGDSGGLRPLEHDSGYLGDPTTRVAAPVGEWERASYPRAWLPTERLARAWESLCFPAPK